MGAERLIKSIEDEGKNEADKIKRDAAARVKEIKKGFEDEARRKAEKIIENARSEANLAKERIISNAKMESRRMQDEKMNEIIDDVFEKAKKRVLDMSDAEKKKILSRLAKEGASDIDNAQMYTDKKYVKLLPGAKAADIGDFGVIAKSEDGKSAVTNTLTEKMNFIKETMRHEIAKVLFE